MKMPAKVQNKFNINKYILIYYNTMIRKRFFCYRNYMGDLWQILRTKVPYEVRDAVYSAWLIHSIGDMLKFDEFEFFRTKYNGILITVQKYVNSTWCLKIRY